MKFDFILPLNELSDHTDVIQNLTNVNLDNIEINQQQSVQLISTKNNNNRLTSKQCHKILPNTVSLDQHKLVNHTTFVCSKCYKSFTSKLNLQRHQKVHSNQRSVTVKVIFTFS